MLISLYIIIKITLNHIFTFFLKGLLKILVECIIFKDFNYVIFLFLYIYFIKLKLVMLSNKKKCILKYIYANTEFSFGNNNIDVSHSYG